MTDLKNIFSNDYPGIDTLFNVLIKPIFAKAQDLTLTTEQELSDTDKKQIKSFKIFAQVRGGFPVTFADVELQDSVALKRSRVNIQNCVRKIMQDNSNAIIFFHFTDNQSEWRISYVNKGETLKNSTNAKHYTYLCGKEHPCRTITERFQELKNISGTIKASDMINAFSVEALTKEFYNDLFAWYSWAVDGNTNVYFPNLVDTSDDDRDNIDVKIIRLITRIMFVWFIKQKNLVPDSLFSENELKSVLNDFDPTSTTDGSYYNAILQNLFFATLNRAIEDEAGKKRGFAKVVNAKDVKTLYRYNELFSISEDEVISLFATIPFLNGGLFECLDKTKTLDGVEKQYNYDGFSRNNSKDKSNRFKYRAFVPNMLFFDKERGLFSILRRYNFTVEENTPNDIQVALDPELLGKVFENLLGVYNPETRETARNQSGSFYTPREIVNYMVDESLMAYLGKTSLVTDVFSDNFIYNNAKQAEYNQIVAKLREVKIFDPACGSGAFPMGLLNRMVDIIQKLSPEENTYNLKLHLIENCIYGSDIQSIAAQITKLRFFISLICDCDKDETQPNFGIPTLPNLETKFVTANTLLSVKKRNAQLNLFEDPEIENTKKELTQIRHEHFSAKSVSRKRALRDKDNELRQKLLSLLAEDTFNFAPENAKQLASWNPYDQNAVSDFFDSEWMFGIKDGFDIVIGNPPYVQLQNNGGALAKMYENCNYKTFARTGDIYCLFYEKGKQLLKQGGHLCFITSNKWMRAGYGEKTREFLATETNPKLLIDFAGVKIFESATVDTNILLFANEKNEHKTICAVTNKQNKDSVKNLSVFVEQSSSTCNFKSGESWVILSPIEQSIKQKIESVGTPLKDWNINIYRGVLTGYNDAFIIDTAKKDEILANCKTSDEKKRTAELIRPILRGRDIKRYGYEWANLWLIATFPSMHYDIEQYPAVKEHLLTFGKERLEQTGKTHIINGENIKARKKTNNKWFETQDSISYWEDFSQPKIVYPNMTKFLPFVYDDKAFLTNQKCFIITGKSTAYLNAFFNSSLFKFCFRNSFPELLGGTRELSKIFFDKIPVLEVDEKTEEQFRIAVTDIQKEFSDEKAKIIDTMIFDLYKLTQEERDAIGYIVIK